MAAWDAPGTEALELVSPGLDRSDIEVVERIDEDEGQALFGFARRLGLSNEQADDAVQDVLLRLWTELRRGTAIANPRGWVYRVMYRAAMDQHRVRRRLDGLTRRLTDPAGARMHSATPTSPDDRLDVWSEVARLPERQRHVLYLRYRADLTFDEISRVLGITPSAARSHATQAMATLRSRLGGPEGQE